MGCNQPMNDFGSHAEQILVENRQERRSAIRIWLKYFVLLNDLEEDTAKKPWVKLGNLYQSKYLVNKLFLHKKL